MPGLPTGTQLPRLINTLDLFTCTMVVMGREGMAEPCSSFSCYRTSPDNFFLPHKSKNARPQYNSLTEKSQIRTEGGGVFISTLNILHLNCLGLDQAEQNCTLSVQNFCILYSTVHLINSLA